MIAFGLEGIGDVAAFFDAGALKFPIEIEPAVTGPEDGPEGEVTSFPLRRNGEVSAEDGVVDAGMIDGVEDA